MAGDEFGPLLDYMRGNHPAFSGVDSFLSPFDRATIFIAVDILGRQIAERLPAITDYGNAIGVGIGTVQKAIKALTDAGAIKLQARGHLGTVIRAYSVSSLWHTARLRPIRFVIGPQETPEFLGLEHGLQAAFDHMGVLAGFRRLRSSHLRTEMVRNGTADCAVVSRKAGEVHAGPYLSFDLPPHTYYSPGSISTLLTNRRRENRPLRVGIDNGSVDHQFLTHLLFDSQKPDVEFVECPYPHAITAIITDHIDSAVWNRITLGVPLELLPLQRIPLPLEAEERVAKELSAARIVFGPQMPFLKNILSAIDVDLVKRRQADTLNELADREMRLNAYRYLS